MQNRVKFDILHALRTVQVSVIDEACVVTPLNSGQSILFFSLTVLEGLCLDNGSFADCPSALSLCSWYPEDLYEGKREGRREKMFPKYWNNITFLLILPAINIICIPPWHVGPVYNYPSCRKMLGAGPAQQWDLAMYQILTQRYMYLLLY